MVWQCEYVIYPECLGLEEYCPQESFNGRCNDGEVIEMKSAAYGRMHIGKCVKKDRGKRNKSSCSLLYFPTKTIRIPLIVRLLQKVKNDITRMFKFHAKVTMKDA